MPSRRPLRGHARLPAAAAALVLALAACNASTPTASPATPSPTPGASATVRPSPSTEPSQTPAATPSGPPVDITALARTILGQVSQLRELPIKQDVPPTVETESELAARLEASFEKDNPPAAVAANERLLKGLGLLPAGSSLKSLLLDFRTSQVLGQYSPDDKKLYVISRGAGISVVDKATFAHEYTHALQDQSFNLKGLGLSALDQGDRGLGRLALVEGDATLAQAYWIREHLTPDELQEFVKAASDPKMLEVLGRTPAILRETAFFPYQAGLQFVLGLQTTGGWKAVDNVYAHPPASTEQILHPEKYAAGEAPAAVTLPADLAKRMGTGWKVGLTDTMGELQIGVWLRQAGANTTVGTNAAAGWGGDRIELLDGPDGAWGIAWQTAWDTAADAAEFESAAKAMVPKLGGPGAVLPGAGGKVRWVVVGSDAPTLAKLSGALGLAG